MPGLARRRRAAVGTRLSKPDERPPTVVVIRCFDASHRGLLAALCPLGRYAWAHSAALRLWARSYTVLHISDERDPDVGRPDESVFVACVFLVS